MMEQHRKTGVARTPRDSTAATDEAGMGLRERKKRERLQRIVNAARKLFVEKGFSQATIQGIAIEADVGLGTLYLYAKSKEDLLVLVFKEYIVGMIKSSHANVRREQPLLEQIMMFFEGHIEYHKNDMVLSRTVLKELSFSSTPQRQRDIDEVMTETYNRLSDILENAVRDGKTRKPLYVGTAAWSIFALYYHLLQGFLCGFFGEEKFRKDLRNALDMLLT
jgi:AcrR family transcriptional regulator